MALSRDALTLLAAAADADSAPLHVRHRGQQRLMAALSAGTVTTSAVVAKGAWASVSSASVSATSSMATTLVSAMVIGFSTGLVALSPTARSTEQPPPVVLATPSRPTPVIAVTPAKPNATATLPTFTAPPRELPQAVVAPPKPTKVSIARETELLASAQRALKAGHPGTALTTLDRYAEECPTGLLYEEATASRVVALCALGRAQDGRRWAEEFGRRYPNSPLAARVRAACPATAVSTTETGVKPE